MEACLSAEKLLQWFKVLYKQNPVVQNVCAGERYPFFAWKVGCPMKYRAGRMFVEPSLIKATDKGEPFIIRSRTTSNSLIM